MFEFNETHLASTLDTLVDQKKLAFGLLLCESMMPSLKAFSVNTGYPFLQYRKCLDSLWLCVSSQASHQNLPNFQLKEPPDTEDYLDPFTDAALSATLSVDSLLRFLTSRDSSDISAIAREVCETVAAYEPTATKLQPVMENINAIFHHPLMQLELFRRQTTSSFSDYC